MEIVKKHAWKVAMSIILAGPLLLAGLYTAFILEAVRQNESA